MKNKKAQLSEISSIAIGVATFAVLIVVAFLILGQGKSSVKDFESLVSTTAVTNESFPAGLGNITNCDNIGKYEFTTFTCTDAIAQNDTGNCPTNNVYQVHMGSGNYTCATAGSFNLTQGFYTNCSFNVSYTYISTARSNALNATIELTSATEDVPAWLPIIIIVGIGAILIGMTKFVIKK